MSSAESNRSSILLPMDYPELFKFSRHAPHVLLKQTMSAQAFNFFKKHANNFSVEFSTNSYITPSIERFWGALLFVDISGFTALSTKMNVDDLRLHINSYFEKIISYADKYEGQTVKFAGDALYIIWQADVDELSEDPYQDPSISEKVVKRAVACALEINKNLSDYKIVFVPSAGIFTDPLEIGSNDHSSNEEVAYLNVHSGLSVGMMAGLDVGANDRWEFLLVGSPLADVAMAEDRAKKGELIISEKAHSLLHPSPKSPTSHSDQSDPAPTTLSGTDTSPTDSNTSPESSDNNNKPQPQGTPVVGFDSGAICVEVNSTPKFMSCTCEHRGDGCYLVNKDHPLTAKTPHESRRSSLFDVNTAYIKRTCQLLIDNFVDAFAVWRNQMVEASPEFQGDSALSIDELKVELSKLLRNEGVAQSFATSTTAIYFEHFRNWAFSTLTATMIAHVHQTAREGYDFSTLRHLQTYHEIYHERQSNIAAIESGDSQAPRKSAKRHSQESPIMRLGGSISAPTHMEADLTAELRNVIVLFIKIDINFDDWQKNQLSSTSSSVILPSPKGGEGSIVSPTNVLSSMGGVKERNINKVHIPSYHFLNRTRQEYISDYTLLNKFQRCMDILTTIFSDKGGQLRQFIVDDKGTVCIGTFGLRGSVNYDDAAAAIESAKSIIVQLREAKMRAGIGITSGKAYCGLVGSPTRHEYAVMGPSVNLSARLMSKAEYLQILCDGDTKERDRVHHFSSLGEIVAKGYSHPVKIYSPMLSELNGGPPPSLALLRGALGVSIANLNGALTTKDDSDKSSTGHGTVAVVSSSGSSQSSSSAARRRRVRNSFLTDHLRSSFNINADASVNLYGRKAEIDTLLRYLLKKVSFNPIQNGVHHNVGHTSPRLSARMTNAQSMPSLSETSTSHNNNTIVHHTPQLDLKSHTIFVCIAGVCGVGKTVFLNEICRVISRVNDHETKVAVFRKRVSSYSSSEPFHSWRQIFREMMAALFRIDSTVKNKNINDVNVIDRVLNGVKLIEQAMTEGGDIMSLLSSINFLPVESENASEIESLGPLSLLRSVDLLARIIQTFITMTKHLVVFAFDDLQWIDFYSWLLIQKVWSEVNGAVLLTTYQTVSAGRTNKRNQCTSTFVAVQETFSDPDRTLIMELNPIDGSAIELLVKDVLERNSFPTANKEKLFSLIYELSGGNPLYAFELIKVCVDQALHNENLLLVDPTLCSFVKDFKSNRVEEVIYFRFDQLEPSSQSVLKVSSIICAFGAPVSVPLLEYLICDDSDAIGGDLIPAELQKTLSNRIGIDSASCINVVRVLRDMIKSNEFLSIVKPERSEDGNGDWKRMSSASHSSSVVDLAIPKELLELSDSGEIDLQRLALLDDVVLRDMAFEFQASIEQHAIYDLMLEEQKHYMHRRVASYYEKAFATRRSGRGTPSELFECGLHLENAQVYHEAFPYFYRSASILSNLGSAQLSHQQMERAHKLLKQMNSLMGNDRSEVLLSARAKEAMLIDESSIIQDRNTGSNQNHRQSLSDITKALQSSDEELSGLMLISKSDAYRMFHGRVDLLETAISIVLKIAQFKLMTFQEVNAAASYYEEALHLILIALSTHIEEDRILQQERENESTNNSEEPSMKGEKMVTSNINGRLYFKDTSYENFYVQDYHLLFRALAGIIFLYRLGYIQDDAHCSKESEAIKWYLQLTTPGSLRAGDSTGSNNVYAPAAEAEVNTTAADSTNTAVVVRKAFEHRPDDYLESVGLAFKRSLLYGQDKLEDSMSSLNRIMQLYSIDHCKDIVQVNFYDPVLPTVCNALQMAVLSKNTPEIDRLMNYLMTTVNVRNVSHSSTMAMIMIPLCSSLVLLRRLEEAFELFHKVYIPLDEEAHMLNKFTDVKKPFGEWLRLMKHAGSNGVDLPGEGDVTYYFPNKFLLRVINNPKARHTLARIRPITHSLCELMGMGRELVNASILYYHVMLSLKFNKTAELSKKEEPLDKCLGMAKYYLDQSLNYTAVRPESFLFCRIMTFLLKIRVLALICKRSPQDYSPSEAKREIENIARELRELLASRSTDMVLVTELLDQVLTESNAMVDGVLETHSEEEDELYESKVEATGPATRRVLFASATRQ